MLNGIEGDHTGIALLFKNQVVITAQCELTDIAEILGLRPDRDYLAAVLDELEVPVADFSAIMLADIFDQTDEDQSAEQVLQSWFSVSIGERFENGILVISRKLKGQFPDHLRQMLNQYQSSQSWGTRNYLRGEPCPWMHCAAVDGDFHLSDMKKSDTQNKN